MTRKTTNPECSAGEFLAAELTAANFAEFHKIVGETLRNYTKDELIAPDALWRIGHYYALVNKYNLSLEKQKQVFLRLPRKTDGLDQDHNSGEQPNDNL